MFQVASRAETVKLPCPGKTTTRSACNRCHSQKLRCIKKADQNSCERCSRLKTSCCFGQRAPRSSLKTSTHVTQGQETATTPSFHLEQIDTDVTSHNWSYDPNIEVAMSHERNSFILPELSCQESSYMLMNGGYNDPVGLSFDSIDEEHILGTKAISPLQMFHSDRDIVDHGAHNPSDLCPVSVVQNLANLNAAFHECFTKLPSLAGAKSHPTNSGLNRTRKEVVFVFDDLFRLTTQFIALIQSSSCIAKNSLENSVPLYEGKVVKETNVIEDCQYPLNEIQTATMPDPGTHSEPIMHMDDATILMIVSCYCRTIEIYLSIFEMMQTCIKFSLPPRTDDNWLLILPHLQIGSGIASPPVQVDIYTPINPTLAKVYLFMVTEVSSRLLEQMTGTMRGIFNIPMDDLLESVSPLRTILWKTVEEKSKHVSQSVDSTRILLLQRSDRQEA